MGLGLFLGGTAGGFKSGWEMGKAARDAQKQQGLERAYGQGSEVTSQYSPEQAAQIEAAASAINPETGQPYYNVSASPEGQYTFTTQGQEPLAGTMAPQYRLGAETGGTYTPAAPTEAQRHRGGLVSQQQYLASIGDPEEAAKIGEQLQTSDVRDLQRKGLERQEADAQRQETMRKDLAPVLEKLPSLEYGSDEYKSAHATIKSSLLKNMGVVEGSKSYANIVLSNSAERKEREEIEDKAAMVGGKSPEAAAKYLSSIIGKTVVFESKKDGRTYLIQDVNGDGKFDANDIAGSAKTIGSFKTGDWVKTGAPQFFEAYSKMGPDLVKLRVQNDSAKELKQMDITARKEVAGIRAGGKVTTYIAEDGRAVEKDPESDTGWSYADGSMFSGVPRIVSAKDTTRAKPPTVAEYNAWAVNNEKAKGETDAQHMARFQAVVKALNGSPATTPAQGPAIGTVYNGKTFKGGDPNKKESWEESAPPPPVEKLTYGQQAAAARRSAFFGAPERARAEREAEFARIRGLYTGK